MDSLISLIDWIEQHPLLTAVSAGLIIVLVESFRRWIAKRRIYNIISDKTDETKALLRNKQYHIALKKYEEVILPPVN